MHKKPCAFGASTELDECSCSEKNKVAVSLGTPLRQPLLAAPPSPLFPVPVSFFYQLSCSSLVSSGRLPSALSGLVAPLAFALVCAALLVPASSVLPVCFLSC